MDGSDIAGLSVANSEIFLNWTTTVAIILGLLGASWKWIFERIYLNRRHRIDDENTDPDLHGYLKCEPQIHTGENVAISITSTWENTSPRSVYISTKDSVINIFEIGDVPFGISLHDFYKGRRPDYIISPIAKFDRYRMGGKTKSTITNITILPGRKDYYLYIHIWEEREREPGQRWGWFRDCYVSQLPPT